MRDSSRARALLRERIEAERAGNHGRVAEINAELAKLGDQAKPPVKKAARRGG